jgi:5-methyltetrahydropteroyltriglutamate--homocysteine methyltransferase
VKEHPFVPVPSTCLGFPRIGRHRELKRALEAYWAGRVTADHLLDTAAHLRREHWTAMHEAGLREVPVGDFALYDHVLDAAVLVGAIPTRYTAVDDPLARYFAMARGLQRPDLGVDLAALEMTKWFDTNYHYIVPEIAAGQTFRLDATSLFQQIDEARTLGLEARPVLLGPVTFLLLSKSAESHAHGVTPLDALPALLPIYEALLGELASRGVTSVQLDEPCLVLDLDDRSRAAYRTAFTALTNVPGRPRLQLTTYFGALDDNLDLALESGCDTLHIDLTRGAADLEIVLARLPRTMSLSMGVVDGRNIWRTDLDAAHALVHRAVEALGANRVVVSSSCSLLHAPIDLASESHLDAELTSWLAFAVQKLSEIAAVADTADAPVPPDTPAFTAARAALASRRASPRTKRPEVRARTAAVDASMERRGEPFPARAAKQAARLHLPLLPTTTIGSFPQTREVRDARAAWRDGRMSGPDYTRFLRDAIRACVERQEAIDLDVLVHGEFERTDMVEYFGAELDGFAFTENGWVQSYGSRSVKPPVLYGDVIRRRPMTVDWSRFAQSLTTRPMKGMLTGPVTILQWSFVRDDQSRAETCRQIALALRDEVADLEAAGLAIVQVDEPAIREGLPLRRRDRPAYLDWAVAAFRLATSGAASDTQIHTHMCYSEFGDMLPAIAAMDADVLSIESSRSRMELVEDFATFSYPNAIGPGVYDIHSPRVPTVDEISALLERAAAVIPVERLWVNPDCGLKTRGWTEVEAALANMVAAARRKREALALTPRA